MNLVEKAFGLELEIGFELAYRLELAFGLELVIELEIGFELVIELELVFGLVIELELVEFRLVVKWWFGMNPHFQYQPVFDVGVRRPDHEPDYNLDQSHQIRSGPSHCMQAASHSLEEACS